MTICFSVCLSPHAGLGTAWIGDFSESREWNGLRFFVYFFLLVFLFLNLALLLYTFKKILDNFDIVSHTCGKLAELLGN